MEQNRSSRWPRLTTFHWLSTALPNPLTPNQSRRPAWHVSWGVWKRGSAVNPKPTLKLLCLICGLVTLSFKKDIFRRPLHRQHDHFIWVILADSTNNHSLFTLKYITCIPQPHLCCFNKLSYPPALEHVMRSWSSDTGSHPKYFNI